MCSDNGWEASTKVNVLVPGSGVLQNKAGLYSVVICSGGFRGKPFPRFYKESYDKVKNYKPCPKHFEIKKNASKTPDLALKKASVILTTNA